MDCRWTDQTGDYVPCPDFSGQNLSWALFQGARLHGANFRGSDLSYADFSQADLTGADLTDAVVFGTRFYQADLTGTVLTNVRLNEACLDQAKIVPGTATPSTQPAASTPVQAPAAAMDRLLQSTTVDHLLDHAPWSESHGAQAGYLGLGLLYYAIPYLYQARTCVCIGSGGGFVPRLMRQAQRDLGLESRTWLIDANIEAGPDWGKPHWIEDRFFLDHWDVEVLLERSIDAAHKFQDIDYLHIDGDHTYQTCRQDWLLWSPRARVITMHDACSAIPGVEVSRVISEIKEQGGWDMVTFPFGVGTTVLVRA